MPPVRGKRSKAPPVAPDFPSPDVYQESGYLRHHVGCFWIVSNHTVSSANNLMFRATTRICERQVRYSGCGSSHGFAFKSWIQYHYADDGPLFDTSPR